MSDHGTLMSASCDGGGALLLTSAAGTVHRPTREWNALNGHCRSGACSASAEPTPLRHTSCSRPILPALASEWHRSSAVRWSWPVHSRTSSAPSVCAHDLECLAMPTPAHTSLSWCTKSGVSMYDSTCAYMMPSTHALRSNESSLPSAAKCSQYATAPGLLTPACTRPEPMPDAHWNLSVSESPSWRHCRFRSFHSSRSSAGFLSA
mmetsp:Transcript_54969/g.134787  ORF Transcript_54969/g.134787 Transcript_54969/m.134787 type:complete len:206 (+) Transcript_54969:208-825(+)